MKAKDFYEKGWVILDPVARWAEGAPRNIDYVARMTLGIIFAIILWTLLGIPTIALGLYNNAFWLLGRREVKSEKG